MEKGISVLMPTYNQATFINRAIISLLGQTHVNWELIIINDGSEDRTYDFIKHHLVNEKVQYHENKINQGLGKCLNDGMRFSKHDYIAYLPSDDVYFKSHLSTLIEKLDNEPKGILAYSGVRHHYSYTVGKDQSLHSTGQIKDTPLQLVQVLHKKTREKWIERDEFVTDDLFRMFWQRLLCDGMFLPTDTITCEWTNHPKQRHKLINKIYGGGINSYREHYKVKNLIRFESLAGESVDEKRYYDYLKSTVPAPNKGLKIMLVGELSYNPERICAFEEKGHRLYGLWMKDTSVFHAVGPLPYGNVVDIQYESWREAVKKIEPDIIYALLGSRSVQLAHEVLKSNMGIPFVWHHKEGPFFNIASGDWDKLLDLYLYSDGQIYLNQLAKDWLEQFLPPFDKPSYLLDGELPKENCFKSERTPLLSLTDGRVHTVMIGRPVGLSPEDIGLMAKEKIHFHFYGSYQTVWKDWVERAAKLASEYFHLHPNCPPDNWVKELSKYDAGWLHISESCNEGSLLRLDWSDMNYPARISTLAAAGLPMIQFDNSSHEVAAQSLTKSLDIGIFYKTYGELGNKLRDTERMTTLRKNVWKNRALFTFDYHVPNLIEFFMKVIRKTNLSRTQPLNNSNPFESI